MKRRVLVALSMSLAAGAMCARAQQPRAFDVASIKPNSASDVRTQISVAPGHFTATGITVKFLMEQAWGVRDFQISGDPGWFGADHYDINAKAEGLTESTIDQLRPFLQTLLADRFQLKFHRETKEMPAFALVVNKGGPRLKPAAETASPDLGPDATGAPAKPTGQGFVRLGRGLIQGQGMSTSTLADLLGRELGRTVTNQTGLNGSFDVDLKWTPEPGELPGTPAVEISGPSVYTALQEQLGLKLDSVKSLVDFLVVDRVERPSEN